MVGAISREFQRSPRRFFNARNLPSRSARMLTSLFRDINFEMHFLREQLCWSLWLLISVAAALCFLSKFLPQVKAFAVLMCLNTSIEL